MRSLPAIQLAGLLTKIQQKDEATGLLFYKQEDVVKLLEDLQFPTPDFEGMEAYYELQIAYSPSLEILDCARRSERSDEELAKEMDIPLAFFEDILFHNEPILPAMAAKLEKIFNVPKEHWLQRETEYRQKLNEFLNG